MSDEKNKIANFEWALMIGVALLFDGTNVLLALIPLLGFLMNKMLTIWAWLTFWLWLKIKGGRVKSKWLMQGGGVLEILPIPFISALPFWTFAIVGIMLKNKAKEILPGSAGNTGNLAAKAI